MCGIDGRFSIIVSKEINRRFSKKNQGRISEGIFWISSGIPAGFIIWIHKGITEKKSIEELPGT